MKNKILFLIKSKITLNIKGNNINRFLKRLKNNNIDLININYIGKDEINIKIYKYDYEKVLKLKTIYEINILKYYGFIKIKNDILNNKYIILFMFIFLIILYVLSNMIFDVEIITNDSKMRNTLELELKKYGIEKYNFQKNYNTIQNIKAKILFSHRSEIEWIEIESIGTKYIIRYEPRIKNDIKNDNKLRNIIAKKDAVIKSMNIASGQVVKDLNSYVKKGDIIVSGYIDLNGDIKDTISSNGVVYGEVWYKVTVTYPYNYKETKETGNKKKVIALKIFNNNIELFNFNKYKTKNIKEKTVLRNNLLPIKLILQNQYETLVIDENNNEDSVIEKAIEISKKKMNI